MAGAGFARDRGVATTGLFSRGDDQGRKRHHLRRERIWRAPGLTGFRRGRACFFLELKANPKLRTGSRHGERCGRNPGIRGHGQHV